MADQFRQAAQEIGFLLLPKFSMMAFLSAVEPLRVANRLYGQDLFAWRAFSVDGAPVEASNGMRIVVEGGLEAVAALPALLVCAGFEPTRHATRRVIRALQTLARRGAILGAIDTGAFLLARGGLLEGIRVTMHWEAVPAFREAFPEIAVDDALFQVDAKRITCAGGTAAMDLMLDRIAAAHGEALATAVSEQLIHERIRAPHQRQRAESTRRSFAHAGLAKAVASMERQLDRPFDRDRVAAHCGLSSRQIERLFRGHLGTTPAAYQLELRLMRARHLLRQTDMSVIAVATAVGFGSASALSRSYRARFGQPPSHDRREPERWRLPLAVDRPTLTRDEHPLP